MASRPAEDAPVLLAYPEAIALPLTLALASPAEVTESVSLVRAALRLARHEWRALLRAGWRHGRLPPAALWVARALPAYRVHREAFAAVARATGATVVAGSGFFPRVEVEAARGWHVADARVRNRSLVFAPGGALLGSSAKVHLTPGAERWSGVGRGRLEDLRPFDTPVGRVGVAVCLDGWYDGVLAAFDGQGTQVLVQPSANDAPWDRAWPPDPGHTEGEAWLRFGARRGLQGRAHLRYVVNPMLVGDAMGFHPRGRSTVLADAERGPQPWAEGRPGVLAIAADAESEGVVTAAVELPGSVPGLAGPRSAPGPTGA